MTLLDSIKLSLRLGNNVFDEQINDLIEAGYKDLVNGGMNELIGYDKPLVKQAIIMYVKAHFGMFTDNASYLKAYESMKIRLTVSYYAANSADDINWDDGMF